jgi:hypothetical protein
MNAAAVLTSVVGMRVLNAGGGENVRSDS